MQAASRESYAAGRAALAGYAAGAEPADIAAMADDLLAMAGLLKREVRLRRALSDPARSGNDRASLLDSLFDGKVGPHALDLVKALTVGRWSSPAELLDGVEQLGIDALMASADKAGDLGEVEDELFRFGQVVSGSPELAAALTDTRTPVEYRAGLTANLLADKAKPATVRLVEIALQGFGGRRFDGALSRLVEAAAARRESQVAYVTVAKAMSEADEERLAAKLAQLYGRSVSLKVTVDPTVLGGVSVLVGSDLYDGTVARRLANARNALASK